MQLTSFCQVIFNRISRLIGGLAQIAFDPHQRMNPCIPFLCLITYFLFKWSFKLVGLLNVYTVDYTSLHLTNCVYFLTQRHTDDMFLKIIKKILGRYFLYYKMPTRKKIRNINIFCNIGLSWKIENLNTRNLFKCLFSYKDVI